MLKILLNRISNGENPSLEEIVETFSPFIPLLCKLKDTSQDPHWHAEGDVYVHTSWVLQELYKLLNQEQAVLTPQRRLALILATAFHDIAKPLTTREKEIDGQMRIVAPHHEEMGASYLAPLLLDCGLPYRVLYQILQLVAAHIVPKRLVITGAGKPLYYKLARQADLELLYYLTKADMLGRLCIDKELQVGHIDMFRLYVEEYGLWGKAGPYSEWPDTIKSELPNSSTELIDYVLGYGAKDFENGLIHTPYEAVARAYPHLEHHPELVLTCGIGGSGKSTWAQQTLPDHTLISLDDLRELHSKNRGDQSNNALVLNIAMESLKEKLRKKERIVWDATNLRREMREKIIRIAENYHALVTLVVSHPNKIELGKRNKSRKHPIAEEVINKQLERFQWPQPTEAHRFLILDCNGSRLLSTGYSH